MSGAIVKALPLKLGMITHCEFTERLAADAMAFMGGKAEFD